MGFSAERLTRLSEIEQTNFWFSGRRICVENLLRKVPANPRALILDLGCGTGYNLRTLQNRFNMIGIDARFEGLAATRKSMPRVPLIRGFAESLPFSQESLDGAILLDVLEHVEDEKVLSEINRVLKPGGWLIVSVPAIPWLWSYRDEAAGHKRRYSRKLLNRVAHQTGFEIVDLNYYQCLLLPLLILSRTFGRKGPRMRDLEDKPGAFLNGVLGAVNRSEAKISSLIPLPWGSSLITYLRKTK